MVAIPVPGTGIKDGVSLETGQTKLFSSRLGIRSVGNGVLVRCIDFLVLEHQIYGGCIRKDVILWNQWVWMKIWGLNGIWVRFTFGITLLRIWIWLEIYLEGIQGMILGICFNSHKLGCVILISLDWGFYWESIPAKIMRLLTGCLWRYSYGDCFRVSKTVTILICEPNVCQLHFSDLIMEQEGGIREVCVLSCLLSVKLFFGVFMFILWVSITRGFNNTSSLSFQRNSCGDLWCEWYVGLMNIIEVLVPLENSRVGDIGKVFRTPEICLRFYSLIYFVQGNQSEVLMVFGSVILVFFAGPIGGSV